MSTWADSTAAMIVAVPRVISTVTSSPPIDAARIRRPVGAVSATSMKSLAPVVHVRAVPLQLLSVAASVGTASSAAAGTSGSGALWTVIALGPPAPPPTSTTRTPKVQVSEPAVWMIAAAGSSATAQPVPAESTSELRNAGVPMLASS